MDRAAEDTVRAPARLRGLVSWQANKVATLGARLTARHMPLTARADFAVLAVLEECGPLSQAEIGRRLGLDRNDVHGILNRLQDHGDAARESDPSDRRRNLVTITRTGRQRLGEIQRHADTVGDELLTALAPEEREQLTALLEKLLAGHGPQPA